MNRPEENIAGTMGSKMPTAKEVAQKVRLAHAAGAGFHLTHDEMEILLQSAEGVNVASARRFLSFFISDTESPALIVPEFVRENGADTVMKFTRAFDDLSDLTAAQR